MCQLAAYVGSRSIAPLLLESLKLQQAYIGAHATGLAVINERGIEMVKGVGHVDHVRRTTSIDNLSGTAGIAHSRHSMNIVRDPKYNVQGGVHPWLVNDGSHAFMHNGVLVNHLEFYEDLKKRHRFTSYIPALDHVTDTEIAAVMLGEAIQTGSNVEEALRQIADHLLGTFLFGVVSHESPHTVWLANLYQPCYVGVGEDEAMFCSSRVGFKPFEDDLTIFQPPKNSLIKLTPGNVEIERLTSRCLPDLWIDPTKLEEHVVRLLREKGERDSIYLIIKLLKRGFREVLGLTDEAWNRLLRDGWDGDGQFVEAMDWLAERGVVEKKLRSTDEGGVPGTPRVYWSLNE